jgi:hypothetical protein
VTDQPGWAGTSWIEAPSDGFTMLCQHGHQIAAAGLLPDGWNIAVDCAWIPEDGPAGRHRVMINVYAGRKAAS